MRPAYLAMKSEAMSVSFMRSSVISQGSVMVGKPKGLNLDWRAALLMTIWSEKASFTPREPESRTMSLTPRPVSFSTRAGKAFEPFTFCGEGAGVLLCEGGHGVCVLLRRRVDERLFLLCGLERLFHDGGVGGHQDEAVGRRDSLLHDLEKARLIARRL